MIFQDPMTALNPTLTIGDQLIEPLVIHQGFNKKDARKEAVEVLKKSRNLGAGKAAERVSPTSYPAVCARGS